jgi:hypothetical protein
MSVLITEFDRHLLFFAAHEFDIHSHEHSKRNKSDGLGHGGINHRTVVTTDGRGSITASIPVDLPSLSSFHAAETG